MTIPSEHAAAAFSPALVLLYGTAGASLKRRPLDRDAVTVGRSQGCDLALEARDVSSIHCVITRTAGGFSVRDCLSRAGTRLNGEAVEEATLHDGDLLKIGPFTFRVVLPPPRRAGTGMAAEPRHLRLERQRRNLVRLALAQRRRLHEMHQALTGGLPAHAILDLTAKASSLRKKLRDFQHRLQLLEQAERDLSRDRANLAQEEKTFHDRARALDADLARRRADLDAEVARRMREQAESIL